MVRTRQGGLEITESGVNPFELGDVFGFAPGHDRGLMATFRLGDSAEGRQSIGEDYAGGVEMVFRPHRNRIEGEARDRRQLDAQGATVIAQRYGRDKRHFVLRAPTDLAATAFAAQIGVIDLDCTFKHIAIFALGHDLHEFVVDQPRRRVAHPQLSLQCKGRQSGLGLADQIDRQEPDRQRQLGTLEHGTSNQRGLMPARIALKDLARAIAQNVMGGMAASRTAKAVRPAHGFKRLLALCLGSVVLQKVRHRQSRLKLNSIYRHLTSLRLFGGGDFTVSKAHQMSLADVRC